VAHVKAVCTSDAKGQAKTPVKSIQLKTDYGIIDDAHASSNTHRQVSLLDALSIATMQSRGYDASYGDFGENIVTDGLPLEDIGIGTILRFGPDARVEISQIGKECHTPCAIGQRTGQCIMPTDGLFAVVLTAGTVHPDDEIHVEHRITRTTIQAVVLTVSDRCSAGQTEDTSGPLLAQLLTEQLNCHIARQCIVPDEQDQIARRLKQFSQLERHIDLIVTTGGTGFAPRDVTPEATASVIERPTPGITEAIRHASLDVTPMAMLSRALAGIRNRTLIVNLPGSAKAVRESLDIILPVLPHAIELLRGNPTDCGRPNQSLA